MCVTLVTCQESRRNRECSERHYIYYRKEGEVNPRTIVICTYKFNSLLTGNILHLVTKSSRLILFTLCVTQNMTNDVTA
jgi:hypothetical protein